MKGFVESLERRRLMSANNSFAGKIFNDLNADGVWQGNEHALAGVRVYDDKNGNHQFDAGERTTLTDAAGRFRFRSLPNGTFHIRQVPIDGYRSSKPTRDASLKVTLTGGQKISRELFAQTFARQNWSHFGGNAQHTGISAVASQPLSSIHWQAAVDLQPQFSGEDLLIHYGSPLVTPENTVIYPVKTQAENGWRIDARNGTTGQLLWRISSDYLVPFADWTPSYQPLLIGDRLYFAGPGGTLYYRDQVNTPGNQPIHQLSYYGLDKYAAKKSLLNDTVFVNTPLTADSAGNVFFGIESNFGAPYGLTSGLVRFSNTGQAKFISVTTLTGDVHSTEIGTNSAPALSNDGKTLYVGVASGFSFDTFAQDKTYLVAVDTATLKPRSRVRLTDPSSLGNSDVDLSGTSSPVVGPDGDVYFGVLDSDFGSHGGRGWLLHFTGDLKRQKPTGSFGWDDSPTVVPAAMVPSYHGSSKYLLMTKYNNYADTGTGDGVNKIAILDPNATAIDPTSGLPTMKEVLTIAGPTPDDEFRDDFPDAVKEWCINTAVVDPFTDSVLAGNEDGKLYRWDLKTNRFSQVITLTPGVGEAYTPTVIGSDGTVYAINNATLFAIGA